MKLSRIQKIIRNTTIVIVLLAALPLLFDMHFSPDKAAHEEIQKRLQEQENALKEQMNKPAAPTPRKPNYETQLEPVRLTPAEPSKNFNENLNNQKAQNSGGGSQGRFL